MGKFSVGRLKEEEGEASSSRRDSKRQRRTRHPLQINEIPDQQQQKETHEVDDCEEEFQFFPFDEDGDEEQEEEGEEEEEVRANNVGRGVVGPSRNGSFSATVTDPEVFDCPICCEPLTVPVFQCENGHIACSTCCTKIMSKCPSCCAPIGYNRCRAIENVLEFVEVKCQNRKYGCKETRVTAGNVFMRSLATIHHVLALFQTATLLVQATTCTNTLVLNTKVLQYISPTMESYRLT